MKTSQLVEMERVLALRFQSKQQVFARIVAEESRLRARLARLDAQAREADTGDAQPLRAIGGDVIWKAWVERAKRSLNLELAQVLAQKERLKNTVRKEYGKVLVSRGLLEDRRTEERLMLGRQVLDVAMEAHFLGTGKRETRG